MEDVSRHLSIAFLALGLTLVWLCVRSLDLVFGLMPAGSNPLLFANFSASDVAGVVSGIGITTGLWKHPRVYTFASEVVTELGKVTWPTWEDTKSSTWTVIGFSIVTAACLAFFDFFWKIATDALLSVG